MVWGINTLAEQGYWKKGSNIAILHTGGLQGRRGFSQLYA
jgi:1-aminocyclopropane-1-carboxylate deaminase